MARASTLSVGVLVLGILIFASGTDSASLWRQSSAAAPEDTPRSVWDGVYTQEQAKRGASISSQQCESCHGDSLAGDQAPGLTGDVFLAEWNGQTVQGLFHKISQTMPQNAPGKLSKQDYADIVADILNLNKFPAGDTELPPQPEVLKQIRIEQARPKARQSSPSGPTTSKD